jgi:hypothetical protein
VTVTVEGETFASVLVMVKLPDAVIWVTFTVTGVAELTVLGGVGVKVYPDPGEIDQPSAVALVVLSVKELDAPPVQAPPVIGIVAGLTLITGVGGFVAVGLGVFVGNERLVAVAVGLLVAVGSAVSVASAKVGVSVLTVGVFCEASAELLCRKNAATPSRLTSNRHTAASSAQRRLLLVPSSPPSKRHGQLGKDSEGVVSVAAISRAGTRTRVGCLETSSSGSSASAKLRASGKRSAGL